MIRLRTWLLLGAGAIVLVIVFNLFQSPQPRVAVLVPYSELLARAANGDVASVVMQNHRLTGTDRTGRRFDTVLPEDPTLASRLAGQGVRVAASAEDEDASPWPRLLIGWLPWVVYVLLWWFTMRRISHEVRALRLAVEASAARGPGGSSELG